VILSFDNLLQQFSAVSHFDYMKKKQNDMIHSKSLGMHSWNIIPDVILCLGADIQNHDVKHMVEQWAGLS